MNDNRQTIETFYAAFAQLDADTMARCYASDAVFEDEVFQLQGAAIGDMWRMLCRATRGKNEADWQLTWRDVQADGATGSAHWDAHYRFSATGRKVHNRIDASFRFTPEGLIAGHRDRFDFWRWSRQALGAPGLLLGWSPVLRKKVRAQAAANLAMFRASNAAR
jgi:ketosteroid isomerase-like protein